MISQLVIFCNFTWPRAYFSMLDDRSGSALWFLVILALFLQRFSIYLDPIFHGKHFLNILSSFYLFLFLLLDCWHS